MGAGLGAGKQAARGERDARGSWECILLAPCKYLGQPGRVFSEAADFILLFRLSAWYGVDV